MIYFWERHLVAVAAIESLPITSLSFDMLLGPLSPTTEVGCTIVGLFLGGRQFGGISKDSTI